MTHCWWFIHWTPQYNMEKMWHVACRTGSEWAGAVKDYHKNKKVDRERKKLEILFKTKINRNSNKKCDFKFEEIS